MEPRTRTKPNVYGEKLILVHFSLSQKQTCNVQIHFVVFILQTLFFVDFIFQTHIVQIF